MKFFLLPLVSFLGITVYGAQPAAQVLEEAYMTRWDFLLNPGNKCNLGHIKESLKPVANELSALYAVYGSTDAREYRGQKGNTKYKSVWRSMLKSLVCRELQVSADREELEAIMEIAPLYGLALPNGDWSRAGWEAAIGKKFRNEPHFSSFLCHLLLCREQLFAANENDGMEVEEEVPAESPQELFAYFYENAAQAPRAKQAPVMVVYQNPDYLFQQ